MFTPACACTGLCKRPPYTCNGQPSRFGSPPIYGCVCPPGAEISCQGTYCPRRPTNIGIVHVGRFAPMTPNPGEPVVTKPEELVEARARLEAKVRQYIMPAPAHAYVQASVNDLRLLLSSEARARARVEELSHDTERTKKLSAPQRGPAPGGSALAKSEVEHRLAGLIRNTHKLLSIFGLSLTIEQERATIDATVAAIMSICGEYAIAALLALGRTG